MTKTIDALKEKALAVLKSGKKLKVHDCSLCNYPCGFIWFGDQLCYDSGCLCVNYIKYTSVPEFELMFYLRQEVVLKRWGLNAEN